MGDGLYTAGLFATFIIHYDLGVLAAGSETPNYASPAPKSLGGRSSQRPSPAEGQDSSPPSSALKGSKVSHALLEAPAGLPSVCMQVDGAACEALI